MNLDNQTLTNIVEHAIRVSTKPDYTGWIIGLIGIFVGVGAIVITIFIYKKQTRLSEAQTRLSNEYERVRKGAISDALKRINHYLFQCKNTIRVQLQMVNITKGTDDDKLAVAQVETRSVYDSFLLLADSILKEADFARLDIDPNLYADIQRLVHHIKLYINEKILSAEFGSPSQNIATWKAYGNTIMQNADVVRDKLLSYGIPKENM